MEEDSSSSLKEESQLEAYEDGNSSNSKSRKTLKERATEISLKIAALEKSGFSLLEFLRSMRQKQNGSTQGPVTRGSKSGKSHLGAKSQPDGKGSSSSSSSAVKEASYQVQFTATNLQKLWLEGCPAEEEQKL